MSGVQINPTMLILAREANQFSQYDLAEKLGVNQANIKRWELGSPVNAELFISLQKTLKFPPEFFLQEGEVHPPTFYRKRDKVSAKLFDAVDANLNIYRININKLIQASGYVPAKLPNLFLEKMEAPENAATELRKIWKVSKGPIANLTEIIEKENFLVVPLNFGTERIDARSMLAYNRTPIIFTNKLLLGDRLRFTLAYELGHLVMHTSGVTFEEEQINNEANLFAAEFLMPKKDILKDFEGKQITLDLLGELKKKWKVSMQSLLYRASDLEFLDYNQTRYLLTQFNQRKIRKREPIELDVAIEKPALLKNLIATYRTKQKLSLTGIAKFFCLTEEEFLKRFAE